MNTANFPFKAGVDSENIEEMYTKAHASIRADPTQVAKVEKSVDKKRWNRARISAAQRNVFHHFLIFVLYNYFLIMLIFYHHFLLYYFTLNLLQKTEQMCETQFTERTALLKSRPLSSAPNRPRNKDDTPCFIIAVHCCTTRYKNADCSTSMSHFNIPGVLVRSSSEPLLHGDYTDLCLYLKTTRPGSKLASYCVFSY